LQARSLYAGQTPNIATYAPGQVSPEQALNTTLQANWQAGYTPDQVAVMCWGGSSQMQALAQRKVGGKTLRHFTGHYQASGEPIWQDGELLVESLRRFKGQSAPVMVLYGVDFKAFTDAERRKLFVGLTRGQLRVDVVMSE